MAEPTHILLFGDASGEKLSAIKDLVGASRTIPAARRFLTEATETVQGLFQRCSNSEHGWTCNIESLLDLAEKHEQSGGDNIIVSAVLSCIGRLGKLVVFADEDRSVLGTAKNPVEVVGLCAGGLPAVVAMAAQDASQICSLGCDLISVSFELALEGRRRMKLIEDSHNESWGKTYTSLPREKAQKILDEFHQTQNIPTLKRVAIAVVAEDWLTMIAPPSTLQALEAWSVDLCETPQLATEVPGPIHSDILPQIDTERVLASACISDRLVDLSKACMLSPSTSQPYSQTSLKGLLRDVIQDIVHNPLLVKETVGACIQHIKTASADHASVNLLAMGSTNYLTPIRAELKAQDIKYSLKQPEALAAGTKASDSDDSIAIVGMAGRFPGSETVEGFWEDLLAGKCHIKEVPKSRFDLDEWHDPSGTAQNSTAARHGAFLSNPGHFDHRLFNISPREAAQIDPSHRLLLTASYEALQSAGYSPTTPSATKPAGGEGKRVATYFGQVADEWQQLMNHQGADIYYVTGGNRAFGPGRLNFHYKWSGASVALDSACSTSATAVGLACSALVARECDMALAGGVSVALSPITFSGLARAGMLSTTGGCRTFHDDADGYARGEGVGAVVLKRLRDAVRDNDNIVGVVRGWTRTYSAEATSITTPSAKSQEAIYNRVLQQACLDPADISYVEMHGTGTQVGDAEEMSSVVSALGRRRRAGNVLTVGAVKANVGHGEGAAGITSLIKALMMLREQTIPPQPGWPFKLNTKFPPLAQSNVKIATKPVKLEAAIKGRTIKILLNSFDASGGNTSLVIEEPPPRPDKTKDPRTWHTVALSGKTAAALQGNRERLVDFLGRYPDTSPADLGYTTTARRIHEPLRCAYVGSSTREIVRQLQQDIKAAREPGAPLPRRRQRDGPKHVFLCTGQGSQYAGMGGDLFKNSPSFRQTLLGYQQMATSLGLPHFLELYSDESLEKHTLTTTKVQLAIVALEMAVADDMKRRGITPDVVIGHSLGEYAAFAITGVISPVDALLLVGRRAELMEAHLTPSTHTMLAANLSASDFEQRISDFGLAGCCEIACENSHSASVATGTVPDIQELQRRLGAEGVKSSLLEVPFAFHSRQLDPILAPLEHLAKGIAFKKPHTPFISTLTGRIEEDASVFSAAYIARQTRERVKFAQALEAGRESGLLSSAHLFHELGPKPMLLGLASQTLGVPAAQLLPAFKQGEDNWRTAALAMKRTYELGGAVNWHEVHAPFQGHLSLVDLPFYAFDSRDYWMPYPGRQSGVASSATCKCGSSGTAMQGPDRASTETLPCAPTRLGHSSLHYVENESSDGNAASATFTSDVFDPQLWNAIKGHRVNGHIVCPMAVFQDFACSAAKYLYGKLHAGASMPSVSIGAVNMTSALVVDEARMRKPGLIVEVTAKLHVDGQSVDVDFKSRTSSGGSVKTSHHGSCKVEVDTGRTWALFTASQHQSLFFVRTRISALREQATTGQAHSLRQPIVYSLFSSVVQYAPQYQAIQQVTMDVSCVDALATVVLPERSFPDGSFHGNPFWDDAVLHLAGFLVNNTIRYPSDTVCIASGFESWQSSGCELRAGEEYTTYAVMQEDPGNGNLLTGACYVFKDDVVIQVALGIKFMKVKRAALDTILGLSHPAATGAQTKTTRSDILLPGTVEEPGRLMDSIRIQAQSVTSSTPKSTDTGHTSFGLQSRQVETIETEAPPANSFEDEESNLRHSETISSIMQVLAAETGVSTAELTDETRYADLGVDSVMAISILAIISKKVGLDLPASFFLENDTIGQSKDELEEMLRSRRAPGANLLRTPTMLAADKRVASNHSGSTILTSPASSEGPSTPLSNVDGMSHDAFPGLVIADLEKPEPSPIAPAQPQAAISASSLVTHAVHYQGPHSTSSNKVFFIADETGSTFRYISLPSLGAGSNIGIYGIDSPLLSTSTNAIDAPAKTPFKLAELVSSYRDAIKKAQPSGPYMLGGMALGAVLAYEVARSFLQHGDEVAGLFILDCASPAVAKRGAAAPGAKASAKGLRLLKPAQKKHVADLGAVLQDYNAQPLSGAQRPRVCMQVVAQGQLQSSADASLAWESLLPDLKVVESGVPAGAFLQMPKSKAIAKILKEGIDLVLA